MLKQNIAYVAIKTLIIDFVLDVVYFPVWWYTAGLKRIFVNRFQSIRDTANHLALRLLILNIFKPMFAQYDRAGRIISFFMRLVILFGRSVYFFGYVIVQAALIVLWVGFPIFSVYRILQVFVLSYVF